MQFSDPVKALGLRQYMVTYQMALELELLKLPIVKGAEFRRQTTKGPDQAESRSEMVNSETKSGFPCELETILGLTLRHFDTANTVVL